MKSHEITNGLMDVKQLSIELSEYLKTVGVIFKVFDRQDSGCISYGIATKQGNFFVKYSGMESAVKHLEESICFYEDITHTGIPKLLNWFTTPSGLALVFEWVEGEVLYGPEFFGKEGRNNTRSPHYRFRQLPVPEILRALNIVYDVHAYLEGKGYIAVDFYDGCMIYNFSTGNLKLCDFDYYTRGSFILDRDRNFGSSRFMAPEEFVRGSVIDSRTNVYTMGAAAFVFLADSSRAREAWQGTKAQYEVCLKAVSQNRDDRYSCIAEFYQQWKGAS